MTYRDVLKEEGITESVTNDLRDAFIKLHSAIARLDCHNLRKFWLTASLTTRLSEFAKAEGLRDVTPMGEECKLR